MLAEYQRGDGCLEKSMPGICEKKELSKRIGDNSASIHTRMVIVPVSISRIGNSHNTQDMICKNIQNGFDLGVGKN